MLSYFTYHADLQSNNKNNPACANFKDKPIGYINSIGDIILDIYEDLTLHNCCHGCVLMACNGTKYFVVDLSPVLICSNYAAFVGKSMAVVRHWDGQ